MSDKRRSINTRFWEDPFIEGLEPPDKLLFLYLISNPLTNLIGIYEISEKRIAYDTGLKTETVRNGLKGFERLRKVCFYENYIILTNFLKHQRLNENMKKGVLNEFNSLPKPLQDLVLGNGSKSFETVRNGLLKLKGKGRESEKESSSLKSSLTNSTPNDEKNNPSNATKKATGEEKYRYFIDLFNQISDSETNGRWKRRFRGDSNSKRQFQARIKEGYTSADFEKGIRKMYRDQFHRENNFKYATPELITRSDKLEKFINQ